MPTNAHAADLRDPTSKRSHVITHSFQERFMNHITGALQVAKARGLQLAQAAAIAVLVHTPAWAQIEIPEVQAPAGVEQNDYVGYMRWGIGVIILLTAAALAGYSLITAGSSALAKFREYTSGRGDVGDVIQVVILGGVLAAFVALLAYAGIQIIPVEIASAAPLMPGNLA